VIIEDPIATVKHSVAVAIVTYLVNDESKSALSKHQGESYDIPFLPITFSRVFTRLFIKSDYLITSFCRDLFELMCVGGMYGRRTGLCGCPLSLAAKAGSKDSRYLNFGIPPLAPGIAWKGE